MPHWRTLIEKDYLGAWDLVGRDGKPRDFTLEIATVGSQNLKTRQMPKGKRKAVVRFKGATKGFVANSTNCETIEGMYGSDTDLWSGRLVTLYATTCDVGPKRGVPCIRVRPTIPKGKAEQVETREVDAEMRSAQDAAFGREPGEEG
jgi:hypothetical protein